MKKILWLLPFSMIFAACPFESTVPMAAHPAEPVDSTLLGYWYGIVKDGSDFFGIEALDISKESDSVYSITRYGKAVKGDIILPDTTHFTGYVSYIGTNRFMNIEGSIQIEIRKKNKPSEFRKEKVYYVSAMDQRNDTLTVKTITETFSPIIKTFKTPEDFQRMVSSSLTLDKNVYDELYSLSYKKIPRPVPVKPM